jgi:AcrR family transcriptional regulator
MRPRIKLTKRGAATRAAIVQAAAELIHAGGVATTQLDEVLAASATSKSQFYRHFNDKTDLVRAVIELRADEVLAQQTSRLQGVESIRGLQQWADSFVRRTALRRGAWGCELGSLAAELADVDEFARERLAQHFHAWEKLLADAFDRMRERGVLRDDVDSMRLAVAVMSAIQGGFLLAQTAHEASPMAISTTMAIDYVKTFELKASRSRRSSGRIRHAGPPENPHGPNVS